MKVGGPGAPFSCRPCCRPDLSTDFLEGLQQYSHCWVLYVFHMNTGWLAELSLRAPFPVVEAACGC